MSAESTALTGKQAQAAIRVAEDELTDTEIAAHAGVSQRTLERWKADPTFAVVVRAHIDRLATELSRYSIARKDKRVAALQERRDRLLMIVEDRATDPETAHIPGARSGYVARRLKQIGAGDAAQLVEEYEADTGLAATLNATEKQAAVEAGQWTEKKDVTSGGESLTRRYVGVDIDAV